MTIKFSSVASEIGQLPESIVSVDPSSTTIGDAELLLSVSVIVCAEDDAIRHSIATVKTSDCFMGSYF